MIRTLESRYIFFYAAAENPKTDLLSKKGIGMNEWCSAITFIQCSNPQTYSQFAPVVVFIQWTTKVLLAVLLHL